MAASAALLLLLLGPAGCECSSGRTPTPDAHRPPDPPAAPDPPAGDEPPVEGTAPPRPPASPSGDLGPLPVLWQTPLPELCFPRALHLHERTLLVCCDDVFAIDAETGAIRHRIDLGPSASCEGGVPDGDGLIVGSNVLVMDGNDVRRRASFVARVDTTGRTTWRRELPADRVESLRRDADGSLLVVGGFRDRPERDHSALYRLAAPTGALTSTETLDFVATDAVTAGGHLLIARPSAPGVIEWRDHTAIPISARTALRLVVAGEKVAALTRTDIFAPGEVESWVEVRDVQTHALLFEHRASNMDFDGRDLLYVETRGEQRTAVLQPIPVRRPRWQHPMTQRHGAVRFYGPFLVAGDSPSEVLDRTTGRRVATADWWIATPPVAAGDRLYVGLTQQVACVTGVRAGDPSHAPRGSPRE